METYIVDASVGVKWFFDEELSDVAKGLIRHLEAKQIRLVVPDIFYVELGNVFWKRVRKGQTRVVAVLDAFDTLAGFQLDRYSDHELSDVALANAARLDIPVYDAVYISLAEIYTAPLITADDVLIKACLNRFDFILPLPRFK